MKKMILLALIVMMLTTTSCVAKGSQDISGLKSNTTASKNTASVSATSVPVPVLSFFQERRTIAKWAQRWDTPNLPCYVYLISNGVVIGYYISDGKPSAITSYLTPEYYNDHLFEGGNAEEPLPDVDGTYGTNNPGIRFFTAEGAAVEWGGYGAQYIYSDVKLPLNVPCFNPKK